MVTRPDKTNLGDWATIRPSFTQAVEPMDVSVIFDEGSRFDSGEEGPRIDISWEGWEASSRTPADNMEAILVENLEDAGRVITYALMVIGREVQY